METIDQNQKRGNTIAVIIAVTLMVAIIIWAILL